MYRIRSSHSARRGNATAALAWILVALFGLAWSLERPRRGALVAGLAVAAAALSRGPWLGLW
ncbi:MAG: hypothetical protein ACK54L_13230, partial [Betaproteobacteria bacterium]